MEKRKHLKWLKNNSGLIIPEGTQDHRYGCNPSNIVDIGRKANIIFFDNAKRRCLPFLFNNDL